MSARAGSATAASAGAQKIVTHPAVLLSGRFSRSLICNRHGTVCIIIKVIFLNISLTTKPSLIIYVRCGLRVAGYRFRGANQINPKSQIPHPKSYESQIPNRKGLTIYPISPILPLVLPKSLLILMPAAEALISCEL